MGLKYKFIHSNDEWSYYFTNKNNILQYIFTTAFLPDGYKGNWIFGLNFNLWNFQPFRFIINNQKGIKILCN